MNDYDEYRAKLCTPDEAVRCVKSGDWVDYSLALGFPALLDRALAGRRDELSHVKVRGNLIFGPLQIVECDPEREHFVYNTWHCSTYERRLCDKGLCTYTPMIFRNIASYYERYLTVDVAMVAATPMDKHGFFNLSCSVGVARAILKKAKRVIVEVNERLPRILGGNNESIHISEVDCVVEGAHGPLPELPATEPKREDLMAAENIMPYLCDGATIQIGIGSMPDALGKLMAKSDLKDLGMHTELCCDAFLALHEAGKLTNTKKKLDRGKGVFSFALGSQALYDWLDDNPSTISYPVGYVNDPYVMAQNDDMISINGCIAADLYGQVCSESAGLRHISGTGGQVDYLTGAVMSQNGKSFLCMTSTYTDSKGARHSRIVPHFGGDIITSPRSQANFIVTEYGAANLAGRSLWERAALLVDLAHPDYRDELVAAAEAQKIWLPSNKR